MTDEIFRLKVRLYKFSEWNDECLESTYSLRRGYPLAQFRNKTIGAHRASWIAHFGEIPQGFFVCHKCDNKLCINPSHLFLGTAKENIRDMINKGRDKMFGRNSDEKKHSDDIIDEIINLRKEGKKYKTIGNFLNLSWHTVVSIIRNPKNKEKTKDIYPKFKRG